MVEMDFEENLQESNPWNDGVEEKSLETEEIQGFDDNFADKLPDSAEYLKRLEFKLSRIQSGKQKPSFSQVKEDLLARLLVDDSEREYIESSDIDPSPVASRIQPIQALNTLELEPLLPKENSQE